MLVGFYDADYVADKLERKSTKINCTFLGESIILWLRKRHGAIALSTSYDTLGIFQYLETQMFS